MDIAEVYLNLRNALLANRNLSVVPKSVTSDVFLVPAATEVTKLKIMTSFVAGLQSFASILNTLSNTTFLSTVAEAMDLTIDDVISITSGALDKLAANYNKTRKTATSSTGIATFYSPTPPGTGTLAAGLIVYTNAGTEYTTDVVVDYTTTYFDTTLNAYALDSSITCTSAGTIGNTPEYSIVNLKQAVPGFGNVTNKLPVTNGTDTESDTAFATRLQNEISGTNVGTINGIKALVLQNMPISDALVVGPKDPIMFRDLGAGGAFDIYILETNYKSTSWTFDYTGEDVTYIEGLRPAGPTLSITSTDGAFNFIPDTGVYAGSYISRDAVEWTTKPAVGSVTLTYFYDINPDLVQTFLAQDDYNTGADILVKQSTQVPIDIVFALTVTTGYSKANVITEITTALSQKIDVYVLGQALEQSDVISWITAVPGVDKVTLPMTKFNRSSLTGVTDTISVNKNEYIRLGVLQVS